jgi:single-strand DNA-binding protein
MDYNKIIMAGRLTRDPQLSYTPSQTAVVDFGLAVSRKWTPKGGQQQEETCFIECTAFGRTGENINKYKHKGDPLFIEGYLKHETWTGQDQTKHSRHKIIVMNLQFLDSGQRRESQISQAQQSQYAKDEDLPF